jgi:serine protease Do
MRASFLGRGICGTLLLYALACGMDHARADEASPRRTRTVEIIQRIHGGIAGVYRLDAKDALQGSGSGSVIADGYILTNDHVVLGQNGVVLLEGLPPLRYEIVGRAPEKDLALLVVCAGRRLTSIPLGRSHDLLAGEPILVGGNPGGRGIVFSSGIVSSPAVMIGMNALVMTAFPGDTRYRFIQLDAAVNPGNSGGPLINSEGVQVGIVSQKIQGEENINYAIPIDRFRTSFHELVAPEERGDCWSGVTVDLLAAGAILIQVVPDGPGARAGVQKGDRVTIVNGKPLGSGIDWLLALRGPQAGDTLALTVERQGRPRQVALKLERFPVGQAAAREGKSPGLRYKVYHGRLTTLSALGQRKPVHEGTAGRPTLDKLEGLRAQDYALVFEGYMEIPETGVYHVVVGSDDGSRVYLGDQLCIDNDGPHPHQEARCLRRLAAGLHRLRVEYFQATGDATLSFRVERDNPALKGPPVPVRFFRD